MLPPGLRTGKKDFKPSDRDLLFEKFVDTSLVAKHAPKTFGHETGFALAMFGNGPDDSVRPGFGGCGCCVWSGGCEETHLVEHAAGRPQAPLTGKEAVAAYSANTGYVIGDDSTDQGTEVRGALAWRRKVGIADATGHRHKIGAFLRLEPGNIDHLTYAMYVFGAVGIGIQFPASAMEQFNEGKPWGVVAGSPIEGGHYIPLVAKRSAGGLECLTWGRIQKMTNQFYSTNCDEAWAIVPTEYLNPETGKSPEGFDQAGLVKVLASL